MTAAPPEPLPLRRPVLGLLVGEPSPAPLVALVRALSSWFLPRDATWAGEQAAAYLWWRDATQPPAGVPCAVWVETATDLDTGGLLPAVWVGRDEVLPPTGEVPTVGVPDLVPSLSGPAGDPEAAVPVAPFTRARVRRARGLPAQVGQGDDDGWRWGVPGVPVAWDLAATVAGVAPAVVATGGALPLALAWAAPTVTAPLDAARVGAVVDVEVLVASDAAGRQAAAAALAEDPARAARLSWAGRQLFERRLSGWHAARRVALALGSQLDPAGGPLGRLQFRLAELGTPPGAAIRERATRAVAPLLPIGGTP